MKTIKYILILSIFLTLNSCQQKMPENYGIYVEENSKFYLLNSQNTYDRGTMVQSLKGIKGTSGFFIKSINSIIVYEHGINPDFIKLSKLEFINQKSFRGIMGMAYENVNLWVANEEIPINIAPVKNKTDMYRVTFNNPLESGFYAIHFGSLNLDSSPFETKQAYDFVIGSDIEPYKSVEERKAIKAKLDATNDSIISIEAGKLLSKINQLYNAKSFNDIRLIQKKEDGSNFNDTEWSDYIQGLDNWFSISGKIKSSKLIRQQITGDIGNFIIQTEYEKTGLIEERFKIIKINSDFYITYIGK